MFQRFFLSVFLSVLAVTQVTGQPARTVDRPELPELVPFSFEASSRPSGFVEWNGFVYFQAIHPLTGEELWRWDGVGDPELVVDLCPGRGRSLPTQMVPFGGRLYFLATDGCDRSRVLWSTDGTAEGTVRESAPRTFPFERLVATGTDLFARSGVRLYVLREGGMVALPGFAGELTPVGDLLFYVGYDEGSGEELWRSDGTAEGTRRVVDLATGPDSAFPHSLIRLASHEGRVYFSARGTGGCAFWRSDGTAEGTERIASLPDGQCSEKGNTATAFAGDAVYLLPYNGQGYQLVRIDGSGASYFAEQFTYPGSLVALGDRVVFNPDEEVWVASGTSATRLGSASLFSPLVVLGGRVLFLSPLQGFGDSLWSTDGSQDRTSPVGRLYADLSTGTTFGGKFLFNGGDEKGREGWVTDGTLAGTRQAFDLAPAAPALDPDTIQRFDSGPGGEFAVFRGAKGLWKVPISEDAVGRASALIPPTVDLNQIPSGGVPVGDRLLVTNAQGELLSVDVVRGTVELLANLGCVAAMAPYKDSVYLIGVGPLPSRGRLLRSDGHAVEDIVEMPEGIVVRQPIINSKSALPSCGVEGISTVRLGEKLIFASEGGLAETDGTATGTRRLVEEPEDSASSYVFGDVAVVHDELYALVVDAGTSRVEIWRTANGVSRSVTEIDLDDPMDARLAAWGESLIVAGNLGDTGDEAWILDGEELRLLADLRPGSEGSRPRDFVTHDGKLFFSARGFEDGQDVGRELWVADSGEDGLVDVRLVRDLRPGLLGALSPPSTLLPPSPSIVSTGEHLLFVGADEDGSELWLTDGSPEGTVQVQDLVAGRMPSSPRFVTVVGEHLFWSAGAASGGGSPSAELWTMPLKTLDELLPAPPPPPSPPACREETACLLDGRFEVTVKFFKPQEGTVAEGVGHPLPFSDESALFWFFAPGNIELIVKVLDGRRINGHFWVFYGGLSNVEYLITVTDTETGAERVFHNPPGEICGAAETSAFPGE